MDDAAARLLGSTPRGCCPFLTSSCHLHLFIGGKRRPQAMHSLRLRCWPSSGERESCGCLLNYKGISADSTLSPGGGTYGIRNPGADVNAVIPPDRQFNSGHHIHIVRCRLSRVSFDGTRPDASVPGLHQQRVRVYLRARLKSCTTDNGAPWLHCAVQSALYLCTSTSSKWLLGSSKKGCLGFAQTPAPKVRCAHRGTMSAHCLRNASCPSVSAHAHHFLALGIWAANTCPLCA